MSQPSTLMELGEKYPNKVTLYTKLKEDRENYMDNLKKLYNKILQLNLTIICLKLRLGTLLENSNGMEIMFNYDVAEFQGENEPQTINNEDWESST